MTDKRIMINRTTHIIQRQRLDVSFRDVRKGLGLPDELSLLYKERIAPLLELVLDEQDRPGYFIRLDRMVIDVGTLPAGRWQQVLPERVARLFREELQKQLQALSTPLSTGAAGDREELETGSGWSDGPRSVFNALLQFLSTGTMSDSSGGGLRELERQAEDRLPRQDQPMWRKRLTQLLAEDPLSLERFLMQLGPSLQEILLQWLGYGNNRLTLDVSGGRLAPVVRVRLETLLRLWQGLSAPGVGPWYCVEAPAVVLEKILSGLSDRRVEEELRKLLPKGALVLRDPDEKRRRLPGVEAPEEGVYIGNAGLVLLHPFLPALMAGLGLLDAAGRWKDAAAQERGLWLSQYLVSGEVEMEEPAIFLNKLLCGYPMEEPVERHWEPSAEEIREVEALLGQVIGHWTALKNTGVGGLRANFLLREGKLVRREDHWLLQVEQKTVDVLLGFLPWGIGYIKTPWMGERLVTEWG